MTYPGCFDYLAHSSGRCRALKISGDAISRTVSSDWLRFLVRLLEPGGFLAPASKFDRPVRHSGETTMKLPGHLSTYKLRFNYAARTSSMSLTLEAATRPPNYEPADENPEGIVVFLNEQRSEMRKISTDQWAPVAFNYNCFVHCTACNRHILGAPPAFHLKIDFIRHCLSRNLQDVPSDEERLNERSSATCHCM